MHMPSIFLFPNAKLYIRFCNVLDGSKSGRSVNPKVLVNHRIYDGRQPTWAETKRDASTAKQNNMVSPERGRASEHIKSERFIMDVIHEVLAKAVADAFDELIRVLNNYPQAQDADLIAPYREAEMRSDELAKEGNPRLARELKTLRAHVEDMKIRHKNDIGVGKTFTNKPIEVRQDTLRRLSFGFSLPSFRENLACEAERLSAERDDASTSKFPAPISKLLAMSSEEAERVLASYAYLHDWEVSGEKGTRFPFDVAFSILCKIKAGAAEGGGATILRGIYLKLGVHRAYCPEGV